MKNEIDHINLLGHKRVKNNQLIITESILNKELTTKENYPKVLPSKKPEFYIITKNENKKLCQKCNSEYNVLCFNSTKNILDYLSKKKILFNNKHHLSENFNFISPKMICLNCLLAVSKYKSELDKFFELNKHEKKL